MEQHLPVNTSKVYLVVVVREDMGERLDTISNLLLESPSTVLDCHYRDMKLHQSDVKPERAIRTGWLVAIFFSLS